MSDVSITAIALISLNGRRPQLIIDMAVDLLPVQSDVGHRTAILSLRESLREETCKVPSGEWSELSGVSVPEVRVSQSQSRFVDCRKFRTEHPFRQAGV